MSMNAKESDGQIDVVYALGNGSLHGDVELRYSLRSLAKYQQFRNVYVIGEKPYWLQNVVHVPFDESKQSRFKERNIFGKVLNACSWQGLSKSFLFINDDHFLLEPFDTVKYYHKGPIDLNRKTDDYKRTLKNTLNFGCKLDFDTHCPILYSIAGFKTLQRLDWNKPFGYGIKSLYCFLFNIKGEYYPDLKIDKRYSIEELKQLTADRKFFSIGDKGLTDTMKQLLHELFPDKSKFEI